MVIDSAFAGNIIHKYTAFGRTKPDAPLVLFAPRREAPQAKSSYELLFQFYHTWQNYVKSGGKLSVNWSMIAQTIAQSIGHRLSDRRLFERLKKELALEKKSEQGQAGDTRLSVLGSIADIFVHRGSRPDLAKKAEKELVQILSSEFYEHNDRRQERQMERVLERKLTVNRQTAPGQSRREKQEERVRMEKLTSATRLISAIERQVKVQENVITELRQKITNLTKLPDSNIKKITGEVMKQMEKEMHLERLRKGL